MICFTENKARIFKLKQHYTTMTTTSNITSGILQDYCLGLLNEEEERKVEALCQQYPQLSKELNLLRQALESYANSNKVSPPHELRNLVWKAVKKIWEENQ